MKLLFFGSPTFAVPSLKALHGARHDIATVVTRPDRPRGRGGRPLPTAVKTAALELGLDVFQPARASAPEAAERLRAAGAELGVVVAYSEILTAELLSVAAKGFVNLHASLLPDYPGAAPINWAIIRGEKKTGVSVIRMAPKLDAGPILARKQVVIGDNETAGRLHDRLATVGADVLTGLLNVMEAGKHIPGQPQREGRRFYARKLTKKDGRMDWLLRATVIRNRVRGLTPWPGVYCDYITANKGLRVTLLEVEVIGGTSPQAEPGTVIVADNAGGLVVKAGADAVRIVRIKPAGGRAMDALDFIHGHRVGPGDRFR